jgi:hypothetical protein
MYLSADRLRLAVERLGSSCATQRLVDFLILKRAIVFSGSPSVELSKNDPHLVQAICDLMETHQGAASNPNEEFPYINIFGTENHSSKGYRSRKYPSNGTAVTVPGWSDVIKTAGQKPRIATFKAGYVKNLASLMLKAHGSMPMLIDAAVWFHRFRPLPPMQNPVLFCRQLIERFLNETGVTDYESRILFEDQQEAFENWLGMQAADPVDYLPYRSSQVNQAADSEGEDSEDLPKRDDDGVELETKIGQEPLIDQPYDPSRTNIVTRQITIDLLLNRIREGEIDLNTAFQRRGDLWSETQKSRLIESLMIRIPLPSFYFDATDDSRWLVVDGLQRLTTLDLFLNKHMPLQNLEFLSEYNDFEFADLPRPLRRRIEETQVTVNLIQPGTPGKVKFYIFRRINTGGLVLNAQEIRHALNQGPAVEFLRRLAKSPEFLAATDGSISDKRMADCEFVLRFMAFTLTSYAHYIIPDLDAFLNDQMGRLNKEADNFDRLTLAFQRAMRTAKLIFEEQAFRKHEPSAQKRAPINKALFEAWAVSLGRLDDKSCETLVDRRDSLRSAEMQLYLTDHGFVQSVTQGTGDVRKVHKRFQTIEGLVQDILKTKHAEVVHG